MIVSGFHAVEEAVRADARRVEWVLFDESRRDRRSGELKKLCRSAGVAVRYGRREALDRLASRHQGVVGRIAAAPAASEEEILSGARGRRLLIVLDEVQDPHNLGAVLRIAEAAGAGVAVPQRNSAPLSETVARASAGAMSRVRIHRAVNLRRLLDRLREDGFLVLGLEAHGELLYRKDLQGDLALVFGAEGHGLRRLVREGCDGLASLPMAGAVSSLNVAAAAAAAVYEAVRQRLPEA